MTSASRPGGVSRQRHNSLRVAAACVASKRCRICASSARSARHHCSGSSSPNQKSRIACGCIAALYFRADAPLAQIEIRGRMLFMKESVLDVLMYLFENYRLGEYYDADNHQTLR